MKYANGIQYFEEKQITFVLRVQIKSFRFPDQSSFNTLPEIIVKKQ